MLYQTEASRAQKYKVWYLSDHTSVISSFSGLPPGLPGSPSKKIVAKMGLVIIIYLKGSFIYLRNEILSHYYLLSYNYMKSLQAALTSVSFRRLLPGMLKCWLPGLQVPPVQNSLPTHQESKPSWCFTIQRSYCALVLIFLLAQWTTAMVLPVTYFASWICAVY